MLLNELTPGTSTYKNTFSDILGGSWLYWLSVLVSMSFILLPIYLVKIREVLVSAPQFYEK